MVPLVKSIRLMLGNTGEELRSSLRAAIRDEPDMELVGEETNPVQMLIRVAECNADVILVAAARSEEEPAIVSHLLMEYPSLIAAALDPSGANACIYSFRVEHSALKFARHSEFIHALRSYWYQHRLVSRI